MTKSNFSTKNTLLASFWIYSLIQLAQWISYAPVFKILLNNNKTSLIAIFVAILALVRAFASLSLGHKWLIQHKHSFKVVMLVSILLTMLQIFCANNNWHWIFLLATSLKLGILAAFHLWRDLLTTKISRIGVSKSNKMSGLFGVIDYSSMAVGTLLGGLLSGYIGVANVMWLDIIALGSAFILSIKFSKQLSFSTSRVTKLNRMSTGYRAIGLVGHGIRSFSDAGFQSLLPIIAYGTLKMDPSMFGIAVSISGLMTVVGSKLAISITAKKYKNRSDFGFLCFASTLFNAVGLGLCFSANSTADYVGWLALACIAGGIASVVTRTIILAGVSSGQSIVKSSSYYFNAVRWFGMAIGAVTLSLASNVLPLPILGNISLLCMTLSGCVLWYAAIEG